MRVDGALARKRPPRRRGSSNPSINLAINRSGEDDSLLSEATAFGPLNSSAKYNTALQGVSQCLFFLP